MWDRDQLQTAKAKRVWMVTVSMMALSIPSAFQTSDHRFQQSLVTHIDACLRFKKDGIFYLRKFGENSLSMAEKFALAYQENGRRQEALQMTETMVAARKKTLGEEHPHTPSVMHNLSADSPQTSSILFLISSVAADGAQWDGYLRS
jgi:hypothetical protein